MPKNTVSDVRFYRDLTLMDYYFYITVIGGHFDSYVKERGWDTAEAKDSGRLL